MSAIGENSWCEAGKRVIVVINRDNQKKCLCGFVAPGDLIYRMKI